MTTIQSSLTIDSSNLLSIRPYRKLYALQEEQQLDELEWVNIIEKFNSHTSSLLIMAKKNNPLDDTSQQKWSIVINYRLLNKNLKYPHYRLPIIN